MRPARLRAAVCTGAVTISSRDFTLQSGVMRAADGPSSLAPPANRLLVVSHPAVVTVNQELYAAHGDAVERAQRDRDLQLPIGAPALSEWEKAGVLRVRAGALRALNRPERDYAPASAEDTVSGSTRTTSGSMISISASR